MLITVAMEVVAVMAMAAMVAMVVVATVAAVKSGGCYCCSFRRCCISA